jgi:hypothetical protein
MRLLMLLLLLLYAPAVAQMAGLRNASTVNMPALADSNSPAYWAEGQLQILNSDGTPRLSGGADQFNLSGGVPVAVDRADHQPMWIEAAWMDADGILYGWYHHEPSGVCAGDELTAPQIGALISYDGGKTFQDLGCSLSSRYWLQCVRDWKA